MCVLGYHFVEGILTRGPTCGNIRFLFKMRWTPDSRGSLAERGSSLPRPHFLFRPRTWAKETMYECMPEWTQPPRCGCMCMYGTWSEKQSQVYMLLPREYDLWLADVLDYSFFFCKQPPTTSCLRALWKHNFTETSLPTSLAGDSWYPPPPASAPVAGGWGNHGSRLVYIL
jgi:hypothetical protein